MNEGTEQKKPSDSFWGGVVYVCVVRRFTVCFLQPCSQVDKQLLYVTDSELPNNIQQNIKLGPRFHGNPT